MKTYRNIGLACVLSVGFVSNAFAMGDRDLPSHEELVAGCEEARTAIEEKFNRLDPELQEKIKERIGDFQAEHGEMPEKSCEDIATDIEERDELNNPQWDGNIPTEEEAVAHCEDSREYMEDKFQDLPAETQQKIADKLAEMEADGESTEPKSCEDLVHRFFPTPEELTEACEDRRARLQEKWDSLSPEEQAKIADHIAELKDRLDPEDAAKLADLEEMSCEEIVEELPTHEELDEKIGEIKDEIKEEIRDRVENIDCEAFVERFEEELANLPEEKRAEAPEITVEKCEAMFGEGSEEAAPAAETADDDAAAKGLSEGETAGGGGSFGFLMLLGLPLFMRRRTA